jgi:hypothetical protein
MKVELILILEEHALPLSNLNDSMTNVHWFNLLSFLF